ncbi:Planctomycete cytochrome C [Roseimaritima multifibrata]|uniref:Planctomycete cytochrome C n=1 Tax=Roseimaritima multifibrata TaxID=1930274 RepID=A0A517MHI9_9BACT|nr:PSD1 and planctomycete cytochrome C domain-containing protein [Roseimaritima multifibrata]QDS94342.1 Planctomycete cytochrome C [Roseimaritima multifibrata]
MFSRFTCLLLGLFIVCTQGPALCADQPNADGVEFFERKIRPLFAEHCFSCHSADAKTVHGSLLLDTATGLAAGGDSGETIDRENPLDSLLIESIHYDGGIQMPPKGKLDDQAIADIEHWVQLGAPFPASSETEADKRPNGEIDFAAGRQFWSFQPLRELPLPTVQNPSWARNRIDTFLLAKMEQQDLQPSPPAEPLTLVRRLYFDLTGLPPTPDQVKAFLEDDSPKAYERLVDELLDTPAYSEKWARWWLDMSRYTDRTASWLPKTTKAHLYRDWVIEAFQSDMPYDDFVRRQLATDFLDSTGPEDTPALGFLALSPAYWKELKLPCEIIRVIVADEWEERVDAVSRTFLGLTVACARCHDHKFDPISTEDYYAMAGIFASTRIAERPMIEAERFAPVQIAREKVGKLETELAKLKKAKPLPKEKIDQLTADIKQIKSSTPDFDTPMANALVEEATYVVRAGKTPQEGTRLEYRPGPRDLPAFIRGNPNRPGPIVPRQFLQVLSESPQPYQQGSGRLELADSILEEAAPLTARVLVNRIWLAHFGQGIVATPSNFGNQGERPSHPDLLEDLAGRFIKNGWSMKRLHREIVLSAAWQQSSMPEATREQKDPSNRWLSRMNRRRLSFEEWRDAMLYASDVLDSKIGGPSIELDSSANRRRTVYATINRRDMSSTLMVHDFPDPTQHSPQRVATTTALQALYSLNGPLLAEQASALVERFKTEQIDEDGPRIERLYQLLFGRAPTDHQKQLGLSFLGDPQSKEHSDRWLQYAQVLLASNEFIFID